MFTLIVTKLQGRIQDGKKASTLLFYLIGVVSTRRGVID